MGMGRWDGYGVLAPSEREMWAWFGCGSRKRTWRRMRSICDIDTQLFSLRLRP